MTIKILSRRTWIKPVGSSRETQGSGRLPLLIQIGYASGNFGKSVQWNTVDFVYLFFLTDIVGLSATLAGAVILVSMIWDAVSDPIFGQLLDRMRKRLGSYQQILAVAAPISFIGFVGLFLLPGLISSAPASAAIVAGFIFRTGYTLVDVPHNAMLANMSADSRQRATLSGYRFFFSSVGSIVMALAVFPNLRNESSDIRDYVTFAVMIGFIYIANIWFSAYASRGVQRSNDASHASVSFRVAVSNMTSNYRLLIMWGVVAVMALLIPVFARMGVFYAKTWLGDASIGSLLFMAYAIGQVASLPVWVKLCNLTEKSIAGVSSVLMMVAICSVFFGLKPDHAVHAAAFFFFAGFAFGGINTMIWAIIPDTIEYTQARTGFRHEALTFGLLLLTLKMFAGLSMALTGWALDASGYAPDLVTSDVAKAGVLAYMTAAPVLGSLICAILFHHLNITHKGHEDVSSLTDKHRT